jgi:hypothetical protein
MRDLHSCMLPLGVYILYYNASTRDSLSLAGCSHPPWMPMQTSRFLLEPQPNSITVSLVGWLPLKLACSIENVLVMRLFFDLAGLRVRMHGYI